MAESLNDALRSLIGDARRADLPDEFVLKLTRLRTELRKDQRQRQDLEEAVERYQDVLERALAVTTARGLQPVDSGSDAQRGD